MPDSFIIHKSCGECARRLNNNGGCVPDKCLPGYKLFLDPMDDPIKYCYLCHARLLRQSPVNNGSKEYKVTPLKCPKHGIVGYEEKGFRKKKIV